jgi:hypothetical protein
MRGDEGQGLPHALNSRKISTHTRGHLLVGVIRTFSQAWFSGMYSLFTPDLGSDMH